MNGEAEKNNKDSVDPELESSAQFHDPLLTCLVFLSSHFGNAKSPSSLTAGLPYDGKIMGPQLFCEAANGIGLKTKIVQRSKISQIPSAVLPSILILKDNQSCVLMARSKDNKKAKVYLPETDAIKDIAVNKLENDYTGYAIFIHPQSSVSDSALEDTSAKDKHWFWSIVRQCRGTYMMVMLAAVFINLFALVSPLFIMNVYDRVIPNNAIETGWALGIGALSVFLFDLTMRILRGHLIDLSGRRIDVIAGRRIYDHVMNMKLADKPKSSGVFASMLRDFDSVRDFFTSATITGFVDLPFTLLFLFVIYQLAGPVVFILAGLMIAVVIIGFVLQIPLKLLVTKASKSSEAKHGLLIETIHGLETIKSINADRRFRKLYGDYLAENAKIGQASRFVSALGVNCATFLQQIASILIVLFGMYLVRDAELSMGGLIASVILGGRAIAPIGQIANLMTRYHQASSALKTLDKIMSSPVERPVGKNFLSRTDLSGKITMEKVDFSYPGTDRKILDNISFSIQEGEKVGIIGRIGSGKSTIARLLTGLYEPDAGTILIDDTDFRQIDPADLRRNTGYIAQDIFLFNGTIRDNITATNPGASEAEILEVSKKSGAHDFISRHPMGYDAPVGEHGNALSGGQKQAIALARAMLLQPSILVCDEPTNAMDMQAEAIFANYVKNEVQDKTLILITHKNTMLPLVDRLILMDQGRIILDGPTDQVIKALNEGGVEASSK